jgi:hypothetical protein
VAHEEKRAWIMLVVSLVGYAVYVALVLGRLDGRALTDYQMRSLAGSAA